MQAVEQVKPDKSADSYTKDYYRTSQPDSFMGFEDLVPKSSEATTEEPVNNYESKFSWGASNDSKPYMKDENDSSRSRNKHSQPSVDNGPSASSDDMKKFQGAKGISSDQLFGTDQQNQASDRLDQYRGSASISSDDIFGEKKKPGVRSVDYQNIKDGMANVTGKLTNMASGVIGSLQSRYSGNN